MVGNQYLEEIAKGNRICSCLAETELGRAREGVLSAVRFCHDTEKHVNLENPRASDLPLLEFYRDEAEKLERKIRDYNFLLSEHLQQGKLLHVFHPGEFPESQDYLITANCDKCNQQIDVIEGVELCDNSKLIN